MAQVEKERYGFSVGSEHTYEEAIARVKETLKEQGFGILSEIDVSKTLKEKLGVNFEPYVILGACNPQFAHDALSAEEQLGLLLPCNVTVRRKNNMTLISAIDAATMMSVVENESLSRVAEEVNSRLKTAIANAA